MHRRLLVVVCLAIFATAAFAKDVYLSVGGSVGAFRTDARIFNPSQTKDIQINAYYLVGNNDNGGVQPVTITVPKRSQVVYDDVIQSLFHAGGLGAIRLTSSDEFVATQRIYAGTSNSSTATPCTTTVNPCTLGQLMTGIDATTAKKSGVLIQLKANNSFRTNIGLVNPNNAAANVTWRLYDKNNAVVGATTSALPAVVQPYGVVTPTNVTTAFNAPGADLSDAWIGYTSDQPLVVYASVVDNGSTDPTYIPALDDADPPANTPTQDPSVKTFDVILKTATITITPEIRTNTIKPGDKVKFRIANTTTDGAIHGFTLVAPNGSILIPSNFYNPGAAAVEQTITIPTEGSYFFFCTNSACSSGHTNMTGKFDVGTASDDPGSRY